MYVLSAGGSRGYQGLTIVRVENRDPSSDHWLLYTLSVYQDAFWPDCSLRTGSKSDSALKCLLPLPGVWVPEVWLEALV